MKTIKTLVALPVLILCITLLCSCAGNPQKAKAKYLANGQNYMKKQQYASAAIEFRNALKIDPRYVDAMVKRWQAYTGRCAVLVENGRSFDEVASERLANQVVPE